MAIEIQIGNGREQLSPEFVAELALTLGFRLEILIRQFARPSEANDRRDVLRARAQLSFVSRASDERSQGGSPPHVKRATPFGA